MKWVAYALAYVVAVLVVGALLDFLTFDPSEDYHDETMLSEEDMARLRLAFLDICVSMEKANDALIQLGCAITPRLVPDDIQ